MENIHLVSRFVEDICDHYNIFNSYFGNILTAVTEAAQNAIEHGNNNNPEKKVEITFKSRSDGLFFTVTDEGDGFDIGNLPDPTDLENDGMAGRGLFLMKTLSDEISFDDNGKTITLFFNITGIDRELAVSRADQLEKYLKGVKKTEGSSIE